MKYTKTGDVKNPTGNRKEDSGIDLFVPNDWNNGEPYKLYFGEQVNIPTAIKFDIPEGYHVQIENKSGVSTKKGVTRGATVCDHGYRGVVHVNLHKGVIGTEDLIDIACGESDLTIAPFNEAMDNKKIRRENITSAYTLIIPGEKIAQAILYKISDEEIEEISNEEYDQVQTSRGSGGFGSTGTK